MYPITNYGVMGNLILWQCVGVKRINKKLKNNFGHVKSFTWYELIEAYHEIMG